MEKESIRWETRNGGYRYFCCSKRDLPAVNELLYESVTINIACHSLEPKAFLPALVK